ncbi:MAG: hypothetical protein AB1679_18840 [Actinomycetota bacterium]
MRLPLLEEQHATVVEAGDPAAQIERFRSHWPHVLEGEDPVPRPTRDQLRERQVPVVPLPWQRDGLAALGDPAHEQPGTDCGALSHAAGVRDDHRQTGSVVEAGDLDAFEHVTLEDRAGPRDVLASVAVELLGGCR